MGQLGLSQFSKDNLNTCDDRIVTLITVVAGIVNIRVLEGRRTWAKQREYILKGTTTVEPGQSKHTPPTEELDNDPRWKSLAVDVVPYPIDWNDAKRFIYVAGVVEGVAQAMGLRMRWGGNWDMDQTIIDDQNFDDLPHFELMV